MNEQSHLKYNKSKDGEINNKPKYLILDIVFYGGGLNYNQGVGNYQELKKITMWDGSTKILVSRWALRYSILEMGRDSFGWKLAGQNELTSTDSNGVVNVNYEKFENRKEEILDFPEFDLFGFMFVKRKEETKSRTTHLETSRARTRQKRKEETKSRTTPVKISHAISLNSYNFDIQFMANLGLTRRAGGVGSNPVNIEEFYGFYAYNVSIDLGRVGVLDDDQQIRLDPGEIKERIESLIRIIMNLKRDIKGRREDISPWLAIAGIYNNSLYETFMDRIRLVTREQSFIKRVEEKREDNNKNIIEISYLKDTSNNPRFRIDIDFSESEKTNKKNIFIFKRQLVEIDNQTNLETNLGFRVFTSKEEFINKIMEYI